MQDQLSAVQLRRHIEQRITERASLGHLYAIEDGPDGIEAILTDEAAGSLWRVVHDAICEAGWQIIPRPKAIVADAVKRSLPSHRERNLRANPFIAEKSN